MCTVVLIKRAAYKFPINGDDFAGCHLADGLNPAHETALKLLGIQCTKHTPTFGVAGNSVRQSKKRLEPCLVVSPIFVYRFPIIRSTDDGADRYHQNIKQFMPLRSTRGSFNPPKCFPMFAAALLSILNSLSFFSKGSPFSYFVNIEFRPDCPGRGDGSTASAVYRVRRWA